MKWSSVISSKCSTLRRCYTLSRSTGLNMHTMNNRLNTFNMHSMNNRLNTFNTLSPEKRFCSHICFNDNKQNLKKFANLKNIDLRKNEKTNKIEIFVDDKILLTNKKNVFALENYDLCFLIKLELLRNRKEMEILKMPLTLSVNNLIDFINLKEGEHKTLEGSNYKRELYHIEEEGEPNKRTPLQFFEQGKVICRSKNEVGDEKMNIGKRSSNSSNSSNSHGNIESKAQIRMNSFEIERILMENKIYEHFNNDLIFYGNNEINILDTHREKEDLEKNINLPSSLNYVENYKIKNLYKEENTVYNKFINIFERIHQVKLNIAKNFETPEQDQNVQKKMKNLIKNLNDSEVFIFYKCSQILHSFIFTYLFLNNYVDYKEAYRYCNLEYIYQYFKWGYVFDVNSEKDASTLLRLSSLRLINKIINGQAPKCS
ncbi:ATP synthase mitochondrial F1 complex assembly factor 2 [Plasmodium brasilianum]|uniref:ATP synthase mitochondrial F1 complex assembly factor 2, putative n=2 Tax=Plasmodium (Plasmodium) TaxID=418103 RepID=A0A1A8VRX5_PLAMA|nr:ATP synthase mitochondrial F1 complex assembly factor 2, putative [Plasmodium malariae]KAI4837892.1 ATP synthase mitochondrial F1 complex assembly factor 2 [Plasmodium brasilianum]SBS83278.1 conserved Plasmodium protein, unknown function [Plasmodium malariae]SCN45029.1 ATP synthase mitochondrial F1 complex assembly factor 2, putative [Plasmodium malariae]